MTIAIHISADKKKNIRESFNFKCFTRIAAEQPAHHFIFIFDLKPDPELYLDANCTPVILTPQPKNSLLRHYWYNYKIPGLLERYNPDVFVTADGTISLRTKVSQCMVIEAVSFKNSNRYLKKFLPVFLRIAKYICVTNPLIEEELIEKYGIKKDKIQVLFPGFDDKLIVEPEQIKEMHTSGEDFFFFEVTREGMKHVVTILKGFSLFKKWQRSNMQLALLLNIPLDPSLTKDLATYKYRNDVALIPASGEQANILSAAYAAICITDNNVMPKTGMAAMNYSVPLITNENRTAVKVFSDAALYSGLNENDISAKMILLYKNEHLRSEQIAKGKQIASQYSWENTTASVWKSLNKIASA